MKNFLKLIVSVAICLLAGAIGSLFTTPSIASWYANLNRPVVAPPNWVFAPVWTTLFVLMGISLFLIWRQRPSKNKKLFIIIFIINLILNIFWSVLFFGWNLIGWSLVEIFILALSILILIIISWKISKTASVLLWPYLAWVCFASYLTWSFFVLNN